MSELTKRILSATLLAVLLLVDLWLGSWWFLALLVVGGLAVYREYDRLVRAMRLRPAQRVALRFFGMAYILLALHGLWTVRAAEDGFVLAAWLFFAVWGTDVGAFIFGRWFGGPKIAPSISPSKTWAGALGGVVFATLVMFVFERTTGWPEGLGDYSSALVVAAVLGTATAVIAQAGDFFESWMKRAAGVKDSGRLIPGHGGLFDRIDGLLPVAIAFPFLIGIA